MLSRSRRELSNETWIVKIGVDAAENKLSKDWAACSLPQTPPWVEQTALGSKKAGCPLGIGSAVDGVDALEAGSDVSVSAGFGAGSGVLVDWLPTLVERFDIEPYSDFSAKWSNFIGLVLFCTDAKFCKKIFIGKLLTRSTRFTCFCTAQTSIFQNFFVNFFRIFWQKFAKIRYFWILFTDFCSDFDEILSEFRR